MNEVEIASCRRIGNEFASNLLKSSDGMSAAKMQGILADIVGADLPMLAPLRDLVSRPLFQRLTPMDGTAQGVLGRDALMDELNPLYSTQVLEGVKVFLNCYLDLPDTQDNSKRGCRAYDQSIDGQFDQDRLSSYESDRSVFSGGVGHHHHEWLSWIRKDNQQVSTPEPEGKVAARASMKWLAFAGAASVAIWSILVSHATLSKCSKSALESITYNRLLDDARNGKIARAMISRKRGIISLIYTDGVIRLASVDLDSTPDLASRLLSAKIDLVFYDNDRGIRSIYLGPAEGISSLLCSKSDLNSLPL